MRTSGILFPIFSLPGKYGIGCFSEEAYKFVDFLKEARQTYWQILPLGPTGYGDSPYQSFSTFAGNPYLISLEDLIAQGLLTKKECDEADFGDGREVDYGKLYNGRWDLLRKAYLRSGHRDTQEFADFRKENEFWLSDYALFMSVKKAHAGAGLSGWEEPYVISEFDGAVADPVAKSGTARALSTDPTFGIAQIVPMEITTTSFVDRNIEKLSPARYYEKVQQMALRALRRKAVGLIVNGAVDGTKTAYGIKTAVNKAGASIIVTDTYTAIDENTLDELYFALGPDTEFTGEAVLQLRKTDLKAFGQLRGTNEKLRLFNISKQGNGNRGVIADGGVQIPYVIVPDLTAGDLIYGNPLNYMLGLFSGYEIRVDESAKAIERMHTILGDVMLGGNVVEHQGFVYHHV